MRPSGSGVGDGVLEHVAARAPRPTGMMLAALLVGASYYFGSEVGFAVRFPSIPTSIVWPPNSLLMAALMLTPARRWWMHLLAALFAHVLIQLRSDVPLLTMLLLFLTNAGEAALGAYAVRRLCGGRPRFGYVRDVVVFLLCAVFAAPFVTSFPDAAAVVLTKWSDNYALVWQARFLSNVLTILTLVPAIVMWGSHGRAWLRGLTLRRFAEVCLVALGLGVAYAVAYSQSTFGPSFGPALLYAPLPFLIWAALRFGAGGASTSLLAVLLISVSYAIGGRGPFTSLSPAEDVVGLQLFIIAISVPMMVLAAVTEERRRASDALSRSEEFNRRIVESSSECIKILDLDGNLLYMSPKGQQLLGFGENHPYLSTSWIDLWGDEGRGEARDAILRAKAGEVSAFQGFGRTLRGELKWWDTVLTPMKDAHGNVERILGVSRDITEQRQAEDVLRESEERFRMMADSTPIMIWMSGTDKLCTYFNRKWLDFRGRTMAEEMGNGWSEGVHPLDFDRCLETYVTSFDARRPFTMEYRLQCHDGEYRWVLDEGVPYYLPGGNFLGYIGSCLDITERKRAEHSLEQLTGRLLQLQDEERRRIARELHDTTAQNLLAIVLNLETLVQKASTLPKEFVDAISECQSLCQQSQAEIRTLSYLLHPPMLDEAGLILALEWLIDGFSRRSGISVDFAAPPDFRRLPSQMETALFRIVQESLTNIYRHSGSTTAEVQLERGESQVRLQVADHGRGIAATGNGVDPTVRRTETLGVGISGMRERLRQMGGLLEVRSNGAGTSVTAVLPLANGDEDDKHHAGRRS